MYMDENDVRSPRDRVDGELLRRLLAESDTSDRSHNRHGDMSGRTDGRSRGGNNRVGGCGCGTDRRSGRDGGYDGDRRGGMHARNEDADARNEENNNCGCGCGMDRRSGRDGGYGGDRRGGMHARNEDAGAGNEENNGCGCGCDSNTGDGEYGTIGNTYPCKENGVEERALAMVYSSMQHFRHVYDPQTALSRGTMFRELDMPFRGDRISARGGNCRGY